MDPLERLTVDYCKKFERVKIAGTIIILVMAIFWASIVSVHPNFWFRILYFPIAFGTITWGLLQPLLWWARHLQEDYDKEFKNILQDEYEKDRNSRREA